MIEATSCSSSVCRRSLARPRLCDPDGVIWSQTVRLQCRETGGRPDPDQQGAAGAAEDDHQHGRETDPGGREGRQARRAETAHVQGGVLRRGARAVHVRPRQPAEGRQVR